MIRWRNDDTLKKELYVGESMIRWIKNDMPEKNYTLEKRWYVGEKRLFEKNERWRKKDMPKKDWYIGERMTRLRKKYTSKGKRRSEGILRIVGRKTRQKKTDMPEK